jgi:NitT/TauT family transport system substrate-binding protein
MKRFFAPLLALALIGTGIVGCKKEDSQTSNGGSDAPEFVLGWSEYPSSSAFGVAQDVGLVEKYAKKWNVKVTLKQTDYDTLLTMYGSNKADAVCITNMDMLSPSLGRPVVAVIPVSTSVGADAVVATGVNDFAGLKGKKTYGLEKSMGQYLFERGVELNGFSTKDFPYANMDPAAAAQAMQTKQNGIESIVVWNPFLMQTIRTRSDAKVVFSSKQIPQEIVDVVAVGKDSLAKPGGDRFAAFICDVFYAMNQRLADPKTEKDTTVALGAKFSNLGYDDMKETLVETKFYKTPEEALDLLNSDQFRNQTTPRVTDWSVSHGLTSTKPSVGFDDENAQVNYSSKYIKLAQSKKD